MTTPNITVFISRPFVHHTHEACFRALVEQLAPCPAGTIVVANCTVGEAAPSAVIVVPSGMMVVEICPCGGTAHVASKGRWTSAHRYISARATMASPLGAARADIRALSRRLTAALGVPMAYNARAAVVLAGAESIEGTLDEADARWCDVCLTADFHAAMGRLLAMPQVLSHMQMSQVAAALGLDESMREGAKTADNAVARIEETPAAFYSELHTILLSALPLPQRFAALRDVFRRIVNQTVARCSLNFSGTFAKLDYIIKEYRLDSRRARLINDTRRMLNTFEQANGEALAASLPHDIKAVALLAEGIWREAVPMPLASRLPRQDRQQSWGHYEQRVLRAVVEAIDNEYIYVIEAENASHLKVDYSNRNTILTRNGAADWAYLASIVTPGSVLNLVRVRFDEAHVCLPELIIYEPDVLMSVTTVASCFEEYGESPLIHLINKFRPSPNTRHIHLGNLSGQLLDDTLHGSHTPFNESLRHFFRTNALAIAACTDLATTEQVAAFAADARPQYDNIAQLIGRDLPASLKGYDARDVVLEPTFISEVLGIQGRFDFLWQHQGEATIIEQKSGKGRFVPFTDPHYDADRPEPVEKHLVQLELYRALFVYEFDKFARQVGHTMLLYSRYKGGLVSAAARPGLLLRAIRMRNLLAWGEITAADRGVDILATMMPEQVNNRQSNSRFWASYIRPQVEEVLQPIREASSLARAYFMRFARFVEKEQLLAKIGNKEKDDSGFASVWLDTTTDKMAAGNIYTGLTIECFLSEEEEEDGEGNSSPQATIGAQGEELGNDNIKEKENNEDKKEKSGAATDATFAEADNVVSAIRLRFSPTAEADTSNFRKGDVVMLYPYRRGTAPRATAQMVTRGSIKSITATTITIVLRNSQTHSRIFALGRDALWAVEHDLIDSSASALYSGLHSIFGATERRRQLILGQRRPESVAESELLGDYGQFNSLVRLARQARDMFIVIGPPGTGKTSYGMLNILQEELQHAGTSVLLTSYTNRAVDEICSKLTDEGIDFVRIGSPLACDPRYRQHLLRHRLGTLYRPDDVRRMVAQTRVFCATTSALNANMHLFALKHFSLAIVDEASQILEPHLIALLCANSGGEDSIGRFVLIGDHKQLPAVVMQTEAESRVDEPELQAIGLTDCRRSFFERMLGLLTSADGQYDPSLVYMLTRQGRMHRDIAAFPNQAFYGGRLDVVPLPHQIAPSNDADGQQLLPYHHDASPLPDGASPNSDGASPSNDDILPCPIDQIISAQRVAFVEAKAPALSPSAKANQVEADIIARIVVGIYRKVGPEKFDPSFTVGVIVPYRNQIATIRSAIARYSIAPLADISIDTVERYQGSQRDYIVYGFTVQHVYQLNFLASNVFREGNAVIDRKLNVAMTRARLHLIMVGNPQILAHNYTFNRLLQTFKSKRVKERLKVKE